LSRRNASKSLVVSRYFAIATDKFTNYTWTLLVRNKSHVYGWVEQLEKYVYNLTGRYIAHLRVDQEFTNNKVRRITDSYGTKIFPSTAYDHDQGGLRERMNLTYGDALRSMLHAAGLSKSKWGLAVKCLQQTRNLSPSTHTKPDGKVPYEMVYGKSVNYTSLRTFGERVYGHIPAEKRSDWC
jgi:hypothetical protein